jgi:hypothetical protein
MNSWIIRWCATGSLLACAGLASANPPQLVSPQFRPLPASPFGHYPTQWRPYPTMIFDPEIRIIMPADRGDLPNPTLGNPKAAEPQPKKVKPADDTKKPLMPELGPEPRPKKLNAPDRIPDAKPISDEVPQLVPPLLDVPVPMIEPRLLNALPPPNDGFRRAEPSSNAPEEQSEPSGPTLIGKPKAWLEMPVPEVRPIVRGSSHAHSEPLKSSTIWRPISANR